MNVSTSKLLLGISIAAYTYCSWDHLSSTKQSDDAPVKGPTLTAAMVNHTEVLALGRDAFDSIAIDRGDPNAERLAQATSGGGTASGSSQSGAAGGSGALNGSALSLEGIVMTPTGHAALINGTPFQEGEVADIPGGPRLFARKIGDDYAIVEAWGQTRVLKLSDPSLASASGQSTPSNTHSASPSAAPRPSSSSGSSPAAPAWDPYAGHRHH